MRHLIPKILCLSLSNIAFLGLLPGGLNAFAQDTPLPKNQSALIDTQLPTSVLDILMRQDQAAKKKQQQAQKAAALKAASLNKKSKKNKAHSYSDAAALPETSPESKRLANKKSKTITNANPLANVGLPIAIPNRIDELSPDPMPELKLATEPTPLDDSPEVLPLRGMSASSLNSALNTTTPNIKTIPEMRLSPAKIESSTATPSSATSLSTMSSSSFSNTSISSTLKPSPSNTLGALPNEVLGSQNASVRANGLKSKTALYLDNLNEKFQAWKEKPREPLPDHVRNIVDTVINTSHETDRNGRPLHYEPLSGIAIFPVIRHGDEKAFGDIPLLFAREYSNKIASVVSPETHIYNPIYTVESIKQKGIGAITIK